MTDSVKRVKLTLEVAGQVTEISRVVSAPTHWDDVSDAAVMTFARELVELSLRSLGYRDDRTEHVGELTLRPNPSMPTDEQLREWFDLAEETAAVEDGTLGLRAIWRNGCDAGMVAP